MPAINGTERRKPNCAPEAVARVVAPPGVIVATVTNKTSGRIVSGAMAPPLFNEKDVLGPPPGRGEANVRHAGH